MPRISPWLLLLLGFLLLLPGPAGRLLLDLLGGITLTLLLLPLLLAGAGLVGWQILRRRLRTCPSCGVVSFGQPVCPACGTLLEVDPSSGSSTSGWSGGSPELDPRDVTITIEAVDVAQRPPSDGEPDGPRSGPTPSD